MPIRVGASGTLPVLLKSRAYGMALSFGYSPWLLGLALLLAGGLTFWSYRRTIPALSSRWKWGLGTLRFLSLALICLLLLEPLFRTLDTIEQPPVLAVLVDDSQSMRVVHKGDTTATSVREHLRETLAPLQTDLAGTARFFAFETSVRAIPDAPFDSLSFAGRRSDVGAALQTVTEELDADNLRAVALVSDGQYNSGQNPARVADRLSVPVHTVTVGDTSRRRDLRIQQLTANDISYVGTEVPIRATLQAIDLDGANTTLTLFQDGTPLDTAQVSLPSGTAEASIDLSFRPDAPGLKQLTVRASSVPGEATTANNVRSITLRVQDNKRTVLLLGAAPSPNYTALRRVLARDANTTLTARVPKQDGSFYGGPLPDSLDQFDVVVCAGFPSSVVPDDAVQRIASLVDDTPAFFALDRQTDLPAWQKHFGGALPATPDGSTLSFTEAAFDPVDAQRSHPIFQIEGTEVGLFRRLPPLQVPTTAWSPTPDATVLGTASRPSLSRSDPALIVRRRAGHRTALLLGTGTWRWATLSAGLRAADPLWPGLTTNILRWVATQSTEQPVRVRPTRSTFDGDEAVEFTGQVYDESQTPVSRATVSLDVIDSTGTTYAHTMEPLGQGRYALDIGTLPEGTYRYEATARLDDATLDTDRGEFSVGALRLEYQQTRADAVLMQRIATRSGGRAYNAANASSLPVDLAQDSTFVPTVSTNTTETELWRTSLFLALILGLLATEWTLRKRFGLS